MAIPAAKLLEDLKCGIQQETEDNETALGKTVRDAGWYMPGYEDDYIKKEISNLHELGPDFKYNMQHKYPSCFVVICNDNFENTKLSARNSDADLRNLRVIAEHYNFAFGVCRDQTKNQLLNFFSLITSETYTHENYSCFFCVILTHGGVENSEEILYVKDGYIKLKEITDFFNADNCKSLAHKPKCFFIQACRGVEKKADIAACVEEPPDEYAHLPMVESDAHGSYDEDTDEGPKMEQTHYIPKDADFMIAYSTPQGHSAFRNEKYGSWFIRVLHHCFMEYGDKLSLMQIMTKVNMIVAKIPHEEKGKVYMQIPSVINQLRDDVYLKKRF